MTGERCHMVMLERHRFDASPLLRHHCHSYDGYSRIHVCVYVCVCSRTFGVYSTSYNNHNGHILTNTGEGRDHLQVNRACSFGQIPFVVYSPQTLIVWSPDPDTRCPLHSAKARNQCACPRSVFWQRCCICEVNLILFRKPISI